MGDKFTSFLLFVASRPLHPAHLSSIKSSSVRTYKESSVIGGTLSGIDSLSLVDIKVYFRVRNCYLD